MKELPAGLRLVEGEYGKKGCVVIDDLGGQILKWNGSDWDNVSNTWHRQQAEAKASKWAATNFNYIDANNAEQVVSKLNADVINRPGHYIDPIDPPTWLDSYITPTIKKGKKLINA